MLAGLYARRLGLVYTMQKGLGIPVQYSTCLKWLSDIACNIWANVSSSCLVRTNAVYSGFSLVQSESTGVAATPVLHNVFRNYKGPAYHFSAGSYRKVASGTAECTGPNHRDEV